jgi:hypothetical protein
MFVMLSVSFLPPECTRGWRRKKNTERVADKKERKKERKKAVEGKEIGERTKIHVLWLRRHIDRRFGEACCLHIQGLSRRNWIV